MGKWLAVPLMGEGDGTASRVMKLTLLVQTAHIS